MYLVVLFAIVFILITFKLIVVTTAGVAKSHTCLVGKTVLVTGGNKGIGYETALGLAARGCRLIIADIDDAEETKQNIIKLTDNRNIITKQFNLASFTSVRKLAKDITDTEDRLDILINNAGVSGLDTGHTEDGNAITMQINHLGPFLLTHLLLGILKKNPGSKIIFVTSLFAFFNNLTVENINKKPWWRLYSYANSKLCNCITTKVLAENLHDLKITVNCVHPGLTLELGAQTTLHVALSKECDNVTGQYFLDCRKFFFPSKANDAHFCKKIFKKSEELAQLQQHEKITNQFYNN